METWQSSWYNGTSITVQKELHYQQKGKKEKKKEKEKEKEKEGKERKKEIRDLFGVQSVVRLTSKPSSSLANVAASYKSERRHTNK